MKKVISKLTILLTMAVLIFACSNDDLVETELQEELLTQRAADNQEGTEYSKLGSRYSKTQARSILAKTMALTMAKNPDIKNFLMEEAEKRFNGDFEILYLMIKDTKMKNGTLADLLAKTYHENFDQDIPRDFFNEEIIKADPALTLYIDSIYFKNPELVSNPTTVAFESAEIDDAQVEFYKGFNAKGDPVKITEYTKNDFIVGIKENERIVLVNAKTFESVEGSTLKRILGLPKYIDPCDALFDAVIGLFQQALISGDPYLIIQVNQLFDLYRCICQGDCDDPDTDGDGIPDGDDDCPNEAGPASNNGCPEDPACTGPAGCDRTNRDDKDEIHIFRFNNCSAFGSTGGLFEGNREMRASVTYAHINSLTGAVDTSTILKAGSFSPGQLRDANWIGSCQSTTSNWVTTNWETYTWDYCTYGDVAKVVWYEEDNPNNTGSLSIGFTFTLGPVSLPVSATIPFANENDFLGDSLVEYCDEADGSGYEYNTGNIRFYYRMEP